MRPPRTTSRTATTAAILLVAGLLAACTTPPPTPSPTSSTDATAPATPTPSRAPTPSVDPTIAQAEAAILEAYQGYWDAKVAAFADPTVDPGSDLERFAVDQAFADVASSVFTFRRNGIKVTGSPVLAPVVSEIVTGSEGSARIVDCVDGSQWQPIYVATGEPAAVPGQATRLTTTSTAYYYVDHWTIRTSEVDRGSPC